MTEQTNAAYEEAEQKDWLLRLSKNKTAIEIARGVRTGLITALSIFFFGWLMAKLAPDLFVYVVESLFQPLERTPFWLVALFVWLVGSHLRDGRNRSRPDKETGHE